MKVSALIHNFFHKRKSVEYSDNSLTQHDKSHRNSQIKNTKNPVNLEPGLEFLDGMSTGTARFIIDREFSSEILEKYNYSYNEKGGSF